MSAINLRESYASIGFGVPPVTYIRSSTDWVAALPLEAPARDSEPMMHVPSVMTPSSEVSEESLEDEFAGTANFHEAHDAGSEALCRLGLAVWPMNPTRPSHVSSSMAKMLCLSEVEREKLSTLKGLEAHLQHAWPQLLDATRKMLTGETPYHHATIYTGAQHISVQMCVSDGSLIWMTSAFVPAVAGDAASPVGSPAESVTGTPVAKNKAIRRTKKQRPSRRKPPRADDVAGMRQVDGRWKVERPWNDSIATFVLDPPEPAKAKLPESHSGSNVHSFLAVKPGSPKDASSCS